jgi:hypothetical protein
MQIIPAQSYITDLASVTNVVVDDPSEVYGEADLTNLELLATALEDALTAQRKGRLAGPGVADEALIRAARRARHQDASALLRTQVGQLNAMTARKAVAA